MDARIKISIIIHVPTGLTACCSDQVTASQQRFRALLALGRMLKQDNDE